jgi:hypothetical protein
MKKSRYEFDPHADLKLQLVKPNRQKLLPSNLSLALDMEEMKSKVSALSARLALLPNPHIISGDTSLQDSNTVLPSVSSLGDDSSNACSIPNRPKEEEISMMVSSRHLILASTYFRNMLGGAWKEATPNVEGKKVISERAWDEEAFVLVMDVIHGHNREVPKKLGVELFCKVAVIVDYYGCHEAIEPFSTLWFAASMHELPSSYGVNCILWICISWVFAHAQHFERMTDLAVKNSKDLINAPALPINDVLGKYRNIIHASILT